MKTQRGSASSLLIMCLVAFAVILGFTSCTIVPTGKTGVPKVFGKVRGDFLESGLHFINPFASVPEIETRTLNYTMSHNAHEGQKAGDDSVSVISSNGLTVKLDISVLYNVSPSKTPFIVSSISGDINEEIVRPQIRSAIRDAGASFTAMDIFSTQKDAFVADVQNRLIKSLGNYGVNLQQVLLRDVQLPDGVVNAITNKMVAQQDDQAMEFVLSKSKKEADQKRIIAQGEADFNRISTAQLTPQILEARRIEAFGKLANAGNMVIVPAGNQMLFNLPAKN